MKRILKKVLFVAYQLFVFGFFIYIIANPLARGYTLKVFTNIHKSPDLLLLTALLTIVDIGIIFLVTKRKPWPYALSIISLWKTWRKRREIGGSWKSAFMEVSSQKDVYEFNAPFAPLDVPYLRMVFIPLVYISIPYLATWEEMIFRNGKDSLPMILLFSVLFGLAHVPSGFRLMDLLGSFGVGMLFAFYYIEYGLHAAVALHVAINLFGVGVLVWLKVIWPDVKPILEKKRSYNRIAGYFKNALEL